MSGQVLGFVRSTHRTAFELMPWFVNGTLDEAERTLVEQHLQECAACRRERDWLVRLNEAYVQIEPAVDSARSFARIAARLETQDARGGVGHWVQRMLGFKAPWLKFAVAVQLGVIVALGWALAVRTPSSFRALGAPQLAVRAQGSVVLVFNPATPESEVRRILRESGARVVDGPTAANGYVLDVAGTPAAALARLRAEPAVLLAEPLQAEVPR